MEFLPFPKLPRLNRSMVITEKLDGTNAQVHIRRALAPGYHDETYEEDIDSVVSLISTSDGYAMAYLRAGSRNRWLPRGGKDDNNGFGRWVAQHADELAALGVGQHFGEWWGQGVQRSYGLDEKRFSLFNVGRWIDLDGMNGNEDTEGRRIAPACCHVVPVLARGPFCVNVTAQVVSILRCQGSAAAPGFMKPEGVIVYHEAAKQMFKVTCENDDKPKGQQ